MKMLVFGHGRTKLPGNDMAGLFELVLVLNRIKQSKTEQDSDK